MDEILTQPTEATTPGAAPIHPPTSQTVPPQNGTSSPFISSKLLFIAGTLFSIVVIIASLFLLLSNSTTSTTQKTVQRNTQATDMETTRTTEKTVSPSILKKVPVLGWKTYKDDTYQYSLEYPESYTISTSGKGTQLLQKMSLSIPTNRTPLFTVLTWTLPTPTLQRNNIESWCFKTLLDEARKENILCAFLSAAAINDIDIDGHRAYTVNYYNSDQEKVDFSIIPLSDRVITVQAITLLNEKRLDNGQSQAMRILETLSLTN